MLGHNGCIGNKEKQGAIWGVLKDGGIQNQSYTTNFTLLVDFPNLQDTYGATVGSKSRIFRSIILSPHDNNVIRVLWKRGRRYEFLPQSSTCRTISVQLGRTKICSKDL